MKVNSLISLNGETPLYDFHQLELLNLFQEFVKPDCTRDQAQNIISKLTLSLLQAFFKAHATDNFLLIPILRGGMAMWTSVNQFFKYPESFFITCKKNKVTHDVSSILMINEKIKPKSIIILDTVVATGDTVCHVVDQLSCYSTTQQSIQVLTCFISPIAIDKLRLTLKIESLSTVFFMQGVDSRGYVIPYLGGDVGDKLYGISY